MARAMSATVHGRDTLPMDGMVVKIEIDGDVILIGSGCRDCKTPVPTGLWTLRRSLVVLERSQRALPACSALEPSQPKVRD